MLRAKFWIGDVYIHVAVVPIVTALVVMEDVVAVVVVMDDVVIVDAVRFKVVIVDPKIELVKNAEVERTAGMLDKYPDVPRPTTVD